MAKRIFKFGSVGQEGKGVGWIGDRYYGEPCIVEFDDEDPADTAHIELLEKAGGVVVELTQEPEPEPQEPEIDITTMTREQLQLYAQEHAIPFTKNMKKAQLFELVSDYVEAE